MSNTPPKSLAGLSVLLVEDQMLIALDTEMLLLELGVAKVETFTTAAEALSWLASGTPDVGILDINLRVDTSFAIAEVLQRRMIPFVFTTGYGHSLMVPEAFSGISIVHKPYTRDALVWSLHTCLGLDPTIA